MLRLTNISKAYGAERVLDQVDLSIGRGEVVALMGANGAGKSTLAKIAAGVLKPDKGHIVPFRQRGQPQLTSFCSSKRHRHRPSIYRSTGSSWAFRR